MIGRLRSFLIAIALLLWPAASQAAVRIDFYSHEFGRTFPHAFVILKGTLDATGEVVDTNLGFSAVTVSPAMLMRSVEGIVQIGLVTPDYASRSTKQFSLMLSDDEYRAVMNVVEDWKARRQPVYNLNTANCVYFIAEIAQALNLKAEPERELMKSPKRFLEKVKADSRQIIASREAATASVSLAPSQTPPADANPVVTIERSELARELESVER
jgi:hypothetical protein